MSKITASEARDLLHQWVNKADARLLNILYSTAKIYLGDSSREIATDTELYRLVYTSARMPNCSENDVAQILASSRKNNALINVTGMLVYTDDRFIQVLEGSINNLMSLYNRISKDGRHGGSVIRFFEPIKERLFADWHMGEKNAAKDEVVFKSQITEEQLKVYNSFLDGDLTSYTDQGMRILKTFIAIS